jgi:hypothetical protein
MTNSQEKRVSRIAQSRGYRLEKVGKGPHHGRFAIVNVVEGSRVASGAYPAPSFPSPSTKQKSGSPTAQDLLHRQDASPAPAHHFQYP